MLRIRYVLFFLTYRVGRSCEQRYPEDVRDFKLQPLHFSGGGQDYYRVLT